MEYRDSDFFIKKSNFQRALARLRKNPDISVSGAKTLPDAFRDLGWEPEINNDGDIEYLYTHHYKLHDEDLSMLKAVAPCVEAGSYIEMSGEEGYIWRWVFNGQTFREVTPEITWPK